MQCNPQLQRVTFHTAIASPSSRPRLGILVSAFLGAMWLSPGFCRADWPQILGPNRDGHATFSKPISEKDWPSDVEPLWAKALGTGYSGAALVDGKVYVTHRTGNQEFLEAMDLQTGETLWKTDWETSYQSRMNPDDGPRCVPTIQDGRALCYGAGGDLTCIQTSDGKTLWSRPLRQEYKAEDGFFGAGSSPLIIDNIGIINIGGRAAGIIGVDMETGKTVWTATNYDASYAAPIQLDENGPSGKPLAMVVTRLKTVVLDSGDGKVQSEIDFGGRGPTVNAAMPIQCEKGSYLLTANYGIGATYLSVKAGMIKAAYSSDKVLSSQYNSPLFVGGRVIGIDGREDLGVSNLRAFDPSTKAIAWQRSFPMSHLIGVGTQVLVLSIDGKLTLIDGTANEMKTLAETSFPAGTYRALPALDGNIMVARSTSDNGSQLVAIQLGKVE